MGSPCRAEAAHRGPPPPGKGGAATPGLLTLMRSFSFCHLSASSSSSMTLSCSCSFCRDSSVCRGGPGGRRRQGAVGEVGSGPTGAQTRQAHSSPIQSFVQQTRTQTWPRIQKHSLQKPGSVGLSIPALSSQG